MKTKQKKPKLVPLPEVPMPYHGFRSTSAEGWNLLLRLDMLHLDAPELIHAATCGLHSGIPECCVAFYLTIWSPALYASEAFLAPIREAFVRFSPNTEATNPLFAFLDQYLYSVQHAGLSANRKIGYIRCPACVLAKRVIKVKACDCYKDDSPAPAPATT